MKDVTQLAKEIAKMFNTKVNVYRTRRGHYHLEANFVHTLLDNILIRLLSHDDPYRIQMDMLRMGCKTNLHNRMFTTKIVVNLKTHKIVKAKSRKPRVLCKVVHSK